MAIKTFKFLCLLRIIGDEGRTSVRCWNAPLYDQFVLSNVSIMVNQVLPWRVAIKFWDKRNEQCEQTLSKPGLVGTVVWVPSGCREGRLCMTAEMRQLPSRSTVMSSVMDSNTWIDRGRGGGAFLARWMAWSMAGKLEGPWHCSRPRGKWLVWGSSQLLWDLKNL